LSPKTSNYAQKNEKKKLGGRPVEGKMFLRGKKRKQKPSGGELNWVGDDHEKRGN